MMWASTGTSFTGSKAYRQSAYRFTAVIRVRKIEASDKTHESLKPTASKLNTGQIQIKYVKLYFLSVREKANQQTMFNRCNSTLASKGLGSKPESDCQSVSAVNTALICPRTKKKNCLGSSHVKHCRPISNLTVMSKLLERSANVISLRQRLAAYVCVCVCVKYANKQPCWGRSLVQLV